MRMRNIHRRVGGLATGFSQRKILIFWITGIAIAGCRATPTEELPVETTSAEASTPLPVPVKPSVQPAPETPGITGPGIAQPEVPAEWPDFIPPDIPVLEGEIRTVLAASSHVRIFYQNVSMEQVLDYLALLESRGFNLEYRVYVQEGFPDNSEEKLAQGEFDAVDITRGDYHMNITYGADPTYDIYLSGFQQEALAAMVLPWPVELPASVPPIMNCPLLSFNPAGSDAYFLTCQKEHEGVEEEYLTVLAASGFEEKQGTQVQNLVIETTVYENDDVVVIPNTGFSPNFFSIEFYLKTEAAPLSWPVDLLGVVPEPARCAVESILPSSPENVLIACTPADDQVIVDYLETLEGDGFVESLMMKGQAGEILTVTMEKGPVEVQLMNSGMGSGLMIKVEQNQP